MELEMDEDPVDWKSFHNRTREYVVFLLLFIFLYLSSYFLICLFRKKVNFYPDCYEDAVVYRISLWMSTFSLSVSIGAALLLPISIISNEVLLLYPNSYYVQWLNSSLIQGLWNHVFLFSNVALFIFLPFAHLFIESEGFPGSSKGIMARVYEALLVLALLGMLIMGTISIASAILDTGPNKLDLSYTKSWNLILYDISNFSLPFLYSCVSFLGVLMLLICTPLGFARLFSVMADLLMKRKKASLISSLEQEHENRYQLAKNVYFYRLSNIFHMTPPSAYRRKNPKLDTFECEMERNRDSSFSEDGEPKRISFSSLQRNCVYPLVLLLLLLLAILTVLMVTRNTLELCFGIKSLPVYSQDLSLGMSSLSSLGPVGATLEIILILYLWCTSIVGLYSLPVFCLLKPKFHHTSMTQVILNCAILLILSSALPVLARSLGITNFDLLGDFGRINWLGNFYIVLFHNIAFAVTVVICLVKKITGSVRHELYQRLLSFPRTPLVFVSSLFQS